MPDRDSPPPTRKTLPRVPGVPGLPLPPVARVPVKVERRPPYLQSGEDPTDVDPAPHVPDPTTEPTRNDLPVGRRAQRHPTLTGSPAPPPSTTLTSPTPEAEQTPVSGHGPLPRQDARNEPRATLVGLGKQAPESLPQRRQEPRRSESHAPGSTAVTVTTPGGLEVEVKKRHLRALWVWVAPFVLTIATSAYGYVKAYAIGFAKGYEDAADRMAAVEGKVSSLASSVKKSTAEIEQSFDGLRTSVNRDGTLYDDHDRRMLKIEKQLEHLTVEVESATPKIMGLAKPK